MPVTRVLVVDDSAFIRKVFRQILSRSPLLEVVGVAGNGEEALRMVAELAPDVVTVDLNMPGVDGLEFIRRQMAIRPLPMVVCSVAPERGEAAAAALELGAVEFVQKPTALATDLVYDLSTELIAKVKAAAAVDMAKVLAPEGTGAPRVPARRASGKVELIVIGVSTGGPQALRSIVPRLPADFPVPVLMVLHIPVGYTRMYAHRLDLISEVSVSEAAQGERVLPGHALLAPAGQHLRVRRSARGLEAGVGLEPSGLPHRPSVDVLFASAAEACGERVVGVVLTGMGSDGLEGSRRIKEAGGRVVSEAESSCVVYGMPRAVEEAGLSDYVKPLAELPTLLAELV